MSSCAKLEVTMPSSLIFTAQLHQVSFLMKHPTLLEWKNGFLSTINWLNCLPASSALSVVLVMDLSTPEVLCVTLEALLKEVRRQIELVISSATKRNKDYEALLPGSSRVSNDHPVWSHSVSRSDAACGWGKYCSIYHLERKNAPQALLTC